MIRGRARPRTMGRAVAGVRVCAALVAVGTLVAVQALVAARAQGQRPPVDPIYGAMAPPGELHVAPVPTSADVARRARIAARAGEATVTIGEIEDHLATLPPAQREAFRTPAGRRGIVERLLRVHLLAREAEARGVVDPRTRHRMTRREQRVLRDLLEEEVRRDPGPIPAPSAPVAVPRRRFAVVLRTPSREVAEAWATEASTMGYTHALARANEVGVGQETPYGEEGAPPEVTPPIEATVWRTLFAIERPGTTSRPLRVGNEYAVVLFAGQEGGYVDEGPDEGARRMIAADRAWAELVQQVRADRVRELDPSAVDGVPFRMPEGRSIEAMRQLADEVAATRAEQAAREAEAAREDQP